ncbi:cupin domain-containing protein [Thalassotalea sediminis]|uniref:cupin domain-containing protein n=1 Tax=Thalassotalea sediminis TaxID=1759089 RepID=UPI00257480A0|nr:cupin domain-containing protein [Thalassotalea sediminis]
MSIRFLFALIVALHTFNISAANTTNLQDIKAPARFDNLYVKPLGTNEHTSSYAIFIKKEVKPHYHAHHTELVYILAGSAQFTLEQVTTNVKAGDFIRILPGKVHSVNVTSLKPLKVLSIQTPEFHGKDRVFVTQEFN